MDAVCLKQYGQWHFECVGSFATLDAEQQNRTELASHLRDFHWKEISLWIWELKLF